MSGARPRAILLCALVLLVVPACIPEGLAFVQDKRVEIVEPDYREKVTLPMTLEWEAEDVDAGSFAVFFDETPIPPGETLDYIAKDDLECRNTPGCPDDVYFADRGIYETTSTSLTVERLPDLDASGGHETHEVTVILLDGEGRRVGESAWWVQFLFDRDVAL